MHPALCCVRVVHLLACGGIKLLIRGFLSPPRCAAYWQAYPVSCFYLFIHCVLLPSVIPGAVKLTSHCCLPMNPCLLSCLPTCTYCCYCFCFCFRVYPAQWRCGVVGRAMDGRSLAISPPLSMDQEKTTFLLYALMRGGGFAV